MQRHRSVRKRQTLRYRRVIDQTQSRTGRQGHGQVADIGNAIAPGDVQRSTIGNIDLHRTSPAYVYTLVEIADPPFFNVNRPCFFTGTTHSHKRIDEIEFTENVNLRIVVHPEEQGPVTRIA